MPVNGSGVWIMRVCWHNIYIAIYCYHNNTPLTTLHPTHNAKPRSPRCTRLTTKQMAVSSVSSYAGGARYPHPAGVCNLARLPSVPSLRAVPAVRVSPDPTLATPTEKHTTATIIISTGLKALRSIRFAQTPKYQGNGDLMHEVHIPRRIPLAK